MPMQQMGQGAPPQEQGMPQMPPELMMLLEVLMQVMSEPPPAQPAGEVPHGLPAQGVPHEISMADPLEDILQLALQRVQQQGDFGGGQQMMNGAQGGLGAMYGAQGGRPPGS